MSERCPHCSFSPENRNDYCELHKPGSVQMAKIKVSDIFREFDKWMPPFNAEQARKAVLEDLKTQYCMYCGYKYRREGDYCCCMNDD